MKAMYSKYGCQINCLDINDVLWYLEKFEVVLLVYAPIATMCLWVLSEVLKSCICKSKNE